MKKVNISVIGHYGVGNSSLINSIRFQNGLTIEYDDKCCQLEKVLGKDIAKNIIEIIQNESNDSGRRMAFIETTIEAAISGADYSNCKTIEDMSKVYSIYFVNKFKI